MSDDRYGLDETAEEAGQAILAALRYLEQEARRMGLGDLANVLQSTAAQAESFIDAGARRLN